MEKEYREMFDRVHASERLRTEVMNMKHEGAKRKRKIPRTALIAAALAIALAGTAFAAVIDRLHMYVFSDEEAAGYTVTGGSMTKYPLSAFSPELLRASESRGDLAVVDGLYFDTWDELCAFLGPDIPCVWPGNGENWTAPYHVGLFHTGSDQLWGVDIHSAQTTDCVLAQIDVYIRTENWTGDAAHFGLHDSDPDGAYAQLDSYQMANGLTAELVQYTGSEEHPHAYSGAYFMQDGILYNVETYGTASIQDDMLTRLHAILDAYE